WDRDASGFGRDSSNTAAGSHGGGLETGEDGKEKRGGRGLGRAIAGDGGAGEDGLGEGYGGGSHVST
ncbi:Hypothetical predicted protein, partial [Olea europaea subsp. europaea]